MHPVVTRVVSFLRRRVIAAAAVAALAGWAIVSSPVLDAAVAPPKLQYQRFTLPNGLTVIFHTDRSTPIVKQHRQTLDELEVLYARWEEEQQAVAQAEAQLDEG